MRGTIDGIEVYLDEDQLPAFTLSVNSLTDPSKVQGVRSTTIRIIATPEARRVLGTEYMAQLPRSGKRPVLRIGDGDVDLFRADVVPVKWTRDVIECLAVGGNASWFEYAKTLKIRDSDLGISELVTSSMQASTWSDTDGLIYFPLVNFGGLLSTVTPLQLRPGIRAFRAISDLMAKGGWTVKAEGRFLSVAERLVVFDPQAKPSIPIPVPISPFFEGLYFTPSSDGVATITFGGSEFFGFDTLDSGWDGVWFRVSVYDFTDKIALDSWETARFFYGSASYGDVFITHDFTGINVKSGHQYAVVVEVMGADGVILPANADLTVTWDRDYGAETFTQTSVGGYTWDMTEGGIGMPYADNTRLDIAKCLPDWTLAELITEIGIVCPLTFITDPTSKTITVWFDSDYFKKAPLASRDWTQLIDHSNAPEVELNSSQAGLSLRYSEDDGDRELWRESFAVINPPGWANRDIELNGVGSVQTITSKFTATVQGVCNGVLSVPFMVDRQSPVTATYNRKVRIMVADGMASGSWTFDGSALTEYPRTYFADPEAIVALPFGNAGPNRTSENGEWRQRVKKMRAKTLTAYLHLRDNELQDFDFGMPTLVDDGSGPAWYWVQEIKDHRFGAGLPTKVTLVKIPDVEYQPPANPPVEFPDPPQPSPCTQPTSLHIVVPEGKSIDTIILDVSDAFDGYFMIEGDPTVHASADADVSLSSGEYCLYTTDASGVPNGAATTIYLSADSLTALDVSAWTAITYIILQVNGLTALDVSAWTAATTIVITANGLTALDASAWTAATYIELSADSLTALDVPSVLAAVTAVYANNCPLDQESVDAILAAAVANPAITAATFMLNGSCAAPSAAGYADKATLQARGCTVYTN